MNRPIGLKFAISISGHRNIHQDNIAQVEKDLTEQLKLLAENVGKKNLELITGLAEGADTIAANIAIKEGIYVRAILPAPKDIYRSDFKGKALTEFEKFIALGANSSSFTFEEIPLQPNAKKTDFSAYEDRKEIYVRLMDYIVRRSNIIIAIWDGNFLGAEGGTSEVVRSYLNLPASNKGSKIEIFNSNSEEQPEAISNVIIWIPSKRKGQKTETKIDVKYLYSEGLSDKIWSADKLPPSVLDRIEQFLKIGNLLGETKNSSANDTLLEGNENQQRDLVLIDRSYNLFNKLALKYQNYSDQSFLLLSLLGGGIGFIFLFYAEIIQLKLLLILYVLTIFSSFFYFKHISKSEVFSIHLTARNAAELMRLRFFSRLSEIDTDPDLNFTKLIDEFHFSRFSTSKAIVDIIRCSEPLKCDKKNLLENLDKVRERWLDDQYKYFSKKENQLGKKNLRINFLKRFLLPASIFQAILLLLFSNEMKEIVFLDINLRAFILLLMGLFPLWFAMWELYENKKASGELQWQYHNQKKFFDASLQEFDDAKEFEVKKKILSKILRQSISELYQWMIHRYHREHEPPSVG